MRWILILAILAVVTGATARECAAGDDNITMTVVSRLFGLTLIHPAKSGDRRNTATKVQNRFRKLAGRLIPQIGRVLEGPARRRIRSLSRWHISWPVVRCSSAACPEMSRARFPALLRLPRFNNKRGRMFVIRVPFRAAPKGTDLVWLSGQIREQLDGKQHTPRPVTVQIKSMAPISLQSSSFRLELRVNFNVDGASHKALEGQFKALLRQLQRHVTSAMKAASGIRFAGYQRSLPRAGKKARFPSRVVRSRYDPRYQIVVEIAVASVASPERLRNLKRAISALLTQVK